MQDCFSLKNMVSICRNVIYLLTFVIALSFSFLMHAVKLLFEDFLNKEMIVQNDNMDLK